jgi:hypothetical protein
MIPRALATSVALAKKTRVTTGATVIKVPGARRVKDRRLSCVLPLGVKTMPLYELNDAVALKGLGDQIKGMWTEATAGQE